MKLHDVSGELCVIDLLPEDDVEVFLRFPEWEKLHAHGGEDNVGVPDTVDADTEKDSGRDKGNEAHPPVSLEVCMPGAPVDIFIEEGADADHGGDDA